MTRAASRAAPEAGAPAGARDAPTNPSAVRHRAPLVTRREVARDTWWLEFESPLIAERSRPGQFVMFGIGLDAPSSWLLPRPFSVGWRSADGRVGFLLRTFGEGTRRLAALDHGDHALLLGPLGRPFRFDAGRAVECVAGGVGLAPFLFLAAEEAAAGRRVRLLYGERSADLHFDPALLGELTSHEAEVFTDDGSAGRRGVVTTGLDPGGDSLLLGCGPTPMLRALARFAATYGRDLQVSVEE
ncbi:MAG: hypothetical protein ACRELC_13210, partial [Gemmatimonadota bacterium]